MKFRTHAIVYSYKLHFLQLLIMEVSMSSNNPNEISVKDSIKTKLIGIMLAVAAVPLIIAILVSYNTSTNKDKTDALSILKSDTKLVESNFEMIIKENVIALESGARAPSTIEYIKTHDQPDARISTEDMLSYFDDMNEKIGDGNTSFILSLPSGDQLLRTDRKDLANITDRDYFQKCISTKKVAVSDIVVSKSAGNRIVLIIVPVIDPDTGELLGTLQRSFDLNVLHEFLASNVDYGYIVDTTGTVAAHSQHAITPDDDPEVHSGAEYLTSTLESDMFESKENGELTYFSWVKESTTGFTVVVGKTNSEIMASAIRSALTIIILGVVLLIIAVIVSIAMARSFTQPIVAVNKSLGALAEGEFIKVDKFDQRKDEFGAISKAMNSVISTLTDIVTNIKDSATSVGESSDELSDMANQISQTTEDVSNAVQEIASGATQQADEIQDASENVGRIGDAVVEVQNSTDDLSTLAGKMKEASEISSKSLASLQESSSDMTAKIDDISSTIQATQTAVNNISGKVEGITSIATQTNLLSLNASIEAARAGEAGKGFAVVAEEIGKLAEDSKAMADDIRKEMDILLDQSKAAVKAAEDVKQGNSDQQIALGETLEAVNGMLADIDSTVSGVDLISKGAQTCESSKNAVVDTMSALSAISEENAASSEETGASMEELSATVTTLAGSANNLKEIAQQLNEEMKFFK